MKKAKQFAVRKLSRRLVAAKEKLEAVTVTKIEKQLATVKEANITKLAEEVAVKQLHTSDVPPPQSAVKEENDGNDDHNDILEKQLKHAKCVQDVVTQVQVGNQTSCTPGPKSLL